MANGTIKSPTKETVNSLSFTTTQGDWRGSIYMPNFVSSWGNKVIKRIVNWTPASLTINEKEYNIITCSVTRNGFKVLLISYDNDVRFYTPNTSGEIEFTIDYEYR